MKDEQKSFDPTSDKLPNGKDPWDDDVLKGLILQNRDSGKNKRQKLARDWFRNELYYNGIQWITFDPNLRRWRNLGLKRNTPTPVTNTFGAYCDLFSSLIASVPTDVTYRPLSSASDLSQTKMNIANELTDAIEQMTNFKERQRESAPGLVRQGEVFLIPRLIKEGIVFDEIQEAEKAKDPMAAMQSLMEVQPPSKESDGQLPNMGLPEKSPENFPDQLNPQEGQEQLPGIPKLVIDKATAFECYMDEEAESLEDSSFFIRERSYNVGMLKSMFPDFAEKISPSAVLSGDISRYFAGALKGLTSSALTNSGYFVSSDQSRATRANMIEYWHDPCKNFPKGIYAILINNEHIVYKDNLPYHDNGKHYKNIIQIRCKRRVENVHGRTPLDDAISKQDQRNKLESFLLLAIYRMSAPHWLLPKDCGVTNISGEPGTNVTYNRVSASQNSILKPEMIPGAPVQPVVLQYLSKIDEDTEYILGITKSLMGQLPPGTPAARALDLLMQRSRDRHADIFTEWNSKWAQCMNMLVKIVRQVKPVDIFAATKRIYGGFAIKVFQEGDFDLNMEIVPETEQPAPARSTAAELSLLQELVGLNAFQMPPDLQYKVFKRFGVEYLNESLESDKEYIAREHYNMLNSNTMPQVKVYDNHPLHFEDHRIFTQSDEYQEWAEKNPDMAKAFEEQHVGGHYAVMQQQGQAQQQAQAAEQQQTQISNQGSPMGA